MTGIHFSAGCFTGINGQWAARWLKKPKYEISKTNRSSEIGPSELLRTVEFLLSEDAEEGVETHREANQLLGLVLPSQKEVDRSTT